ncbi:MAG: hypothetical protein H8E91_07710 [Planctomycetes bacterium]|nr:hypothetical protein [Planctomycetota bacterium]
MSKLNKCKTGTCPAPWILGGAFFGLIVGVLTDNIALWTGVGVAVGVAIGCSRSSTCSSNETEEKNG